MSILSQRAQPKRKRETEIGAMEEMFIRFCETLTNNPWLQALVIGAGSGLLEDPARCAVVVMFAAGHISNWWLTFASMTLGAVVADVILYAIGRFAIQVLIRYRLTEMERIDYIKEKYGNHAVWATFIARFVPGLRMLVYISVGSMKYPFGRFVAILSLAAAIQAYLFLLAAHYISIHILPYLESKVAQGVLVVMLIAAFFVLTRFLTTRTQKHEEEIHHHHSDITQ
jgi:membrane protein DedA with SNARE-associated domain